MNESMGRGDFNTAEIYANKIAKNEAAYEKKQVERMVKEKGMTKSDAESSVRDAKTQNDPFGKITEYTKDIAGYVKKINDNLPQKALKA